MWKYLQILFPWLQQRRKDNVVVSASILNEQSGFDVFSKSCRNFCSGRGLKPNLSLFNMPYIEPGCSLKTLKKNNQNNKKWKASKPFTKTTKFLPEFFRKLIKKSFFLLFKLSLSWSWGTNSDLGSFTKFFLQDWTLNRSFTVFILKFLFYIFKGIWITFQLKKTLRKLSPSVTGI